MNSEELKALLKFVRELSISQYTELLELMKLERRKCDVRLTAESVARDRGEVLDDVIIAHLKQYIAGNLPEATKGEVVEEDI